MKRLIALVAALGLLAASPAFAQESEAKTETKTAHIKIVRTAEGKVEVETSGDDVEVEVESDFKQHIEALKKRLEELRKDLEDGEAVDLEALMKRVEEALDKVMKKAGDEDATPRVKIRKYKHEEGADNDGHRQDFEKRMEEMRKRHEERFERLRKQMEELENDPEAEVEEWEETSEDGRSHVKIKIVRKTGKSESTEPETPKEEKKEAERKQ